MDKKSGTGEPAKQPPTGGVDLQKAKEAISLMGDANTAVLQMLEMMKSESSSTITSTNPGSGFLELKASMDCNEGSCRVGNLPKLFNIWLRDKKIPENVLKELEDYLEELSLQDWSGPCQRKLFELVFQDGKGFYWVLGVAFFPQKNPERDAVRYMKFFYKTSFKVAPAYMIVRETYKDWFTTEVEDRIVYLPATLTDDHIKSLKSICLNAMCTTFGEGGQLIGRIEPPPSGQ